jgi:hypothetical protein
MEPPPRTEGAHEAAQIAYLRADVAAGRRQASPHEMGSQQVRNAENRAPYSPQRR